MNTAPTAALKWIWKGKIMRKIKLFVGDNVRILSLTAITESLSDVSRTYNVCTDVIQPEITKSIYINVNGTIETKIEAANET